MAAPLGRTRMRQSRCNRFCLRRGALPRGPGSGLRLRLWGDLTVAPNSLGGTRQPHLEREVGRLDRVAPSVRFQKPLSTDVERVPTSTTLTRGAKNLLFGRFGSHLFSLVAGVGHFLVLTRRCARGCSVRHFTG